PPSPRTIGPFTSAIWRHYFQEKPLTANVKTYGPWGTGEYDFKIYGYCPEEYYTGQLLEDWEISPDKVIWHVRPGVYWHDHMPWVMEGREVVADDLVAYLHWYRDGDAGAAFKTMAGGDIHATGRYTLEIEMTKIDPYGLLYKVGWEDRSTVMPPESIKASDEWENQVGTGAFRFKELVLGSHMRLERNPNYWDTMTIDGVEYQLPFLDEVMCVIIKDDATALAALQTGKLDLGGYAPPYWDTLRATQLEHVLFPSAVCAMAVLKVTQPPFDNIDVRRALRIGTDMAAFGTLIGGAQPVNFYP
ncbi:unnamed protein product, partial [marine sediment metagenome]